MVLLDENWRHSALKFSTEADLILLFKRLQSNFVDSRPLQVVSASTCKHFYWLLSCCCPHSTRPQIYIGSESHSEMAFNTHLATQLSAFLTCKCLHLFHLCKTLGEKAIIINEKYISVPSIFLGEQGDLFDLMMLKTFLKGTGEVKPFFIEISAVLMF